MATDDLRARCLQLVSEWPEDELDRLFVELRTGFSMFRLKSLPWNMPFNTSWPTPEQTKVFLDGSRGGWLNEFLEGYDDLADDGERESDCDEW